ncbi:MAG: circadian clock protein LdpA, partial [Coleofasciculus sp.]
MTKLYTPLQSLREGRWFKLICGASFQHLPAVRNLTLAYTLAGADCIDVAADPAVIAAAKTALGVATSLVESGQAQGMGYSNQPWLMVSLNDGEDPHFRKAEFNPNACPPDCPRPCQTICPAQAIVFEPPPTPLEPLSQGKPDQPLTYPHSPKGFSGVIDQRCYGCGRCLPVCPSQLIYTRSYVSTPTTLAELILSTGVDALEIHTQVGHFTDFKRLWGAIAPWMHTLKLLAISCPDGEGLIDYLWELYHLITPLPCPLLWQTDGKPMSGDIGTGTTRKAVKLAQKVLSANLPGYVQLAGGTNHHTVSKLKAVGLLNPATPEDATANPIQPFVAGVAYGSYARV